MRIILARGWNKIKWPLFLILWTAGTISWMYFYQELKIIRCEANWAYSESVKIHNQEDDGKAVSSLSNGDETATQVSLVADTEDQIAVSIPTIEELIKKHFSDDYQIAKAVFTAESGLQKDAQGWNCHYGTTSKACAPQDRGKAWSVDCGVAQINVIGKVCPQELFDPDHNLEVARKKYEARKWQPWCAYTSKKYLAYL